MNRKSLFQSAFAALTLLAGSAQAIDTDLFIREPGDAGKPNVLILLDNAAHWNNNSNTFPDVGGRKAKDVVHEALYRVVDSLADDFAINLGFMGYTPDGSPEGGKLHHRIQPISAAYKSTLKSYIYAQPFVCSDGGANDGLEGDFDCDGTPFEQADDFEDFFASLANDETIEDGNNTNLGRGMIEAYEYFGGRKPRSGVHSDPVDCTITATKCVAGTNFFDEDAWFNSTQTDPDTGSSSIYDTPIDLVDNQCGDLFIIVVSTGEPQSSENTAQKIYYDGGNDPKKSPDEILDDVGGNSTQIDLGNNNTGGAFEENLADEWARFLSNQTTDVYDDDGDGIRGSANDPDEIDQNIITYVIDVFAPEDPSDPTRTDIGNNNYKGARKLMQSIANQGDGKYFTASNPEAVVEAFETIFDEIADVNTVFASTALPVSVNVRGTNLNQIYLGVFRANPQNRPRWYGNLKAYQLGLSNGNPILVDRDGDAARNANTGFINPTASSFWTHDSTFWAFDPDTYEDDSDDPDGAIVEKGGVGQGLRENFGVDGSSRNVYTCVDGCTAGGGTLLSSTPFDTTLGSTYKVDMCDLDDALNSGSPDGLLGTGSDCDADTLIGWYRGQDQDNTDGEFGDEDTDTDFEEARSSIHGDVLHSRPAIFNYNRSGNDDDVVLFYGSNGGQIEAVQGGLVDPADSTGGDGAGSFALPAAGSELWAFIAEEHFGKLSQLYENQVLASDADGNATTVDREIYFDGPISVYAEEAVGHVDNQYHAVDGDKVYIIATARRGGPLIYAFDVSDPAAPELLWRKRGTDAELGITADAGFEELGQTWSEVKVTQIRLDTDGDSVAETIDVLVLAKGYDATDKSCPDGTVIGPDDYVPDADNDSRLRTCEDSVGTGVMVLDLETGYPLWQVGPDSTDFSAPVSSPFASLTATYKVQADMIHSMPADIILVDRERDGISEKLYVGDSGGQVWRIDFNTDISEWAVNKFANLGNHYDGDGDPAADSFNALLIGQNSQDNDRRFLFPADVVIATPGDSRGEFDAVLIGSGNREQPDEEVTQDRFYMIKDHVTTALADADGTPAGWPYTDTPEDDPDTPAAGVEVDNDDADTTNDAEDFLEGDFYDATDDFISSDNSVTSRNAELLLDAAEGWYIDLLVGEKVVSSPVTLAGITFFNTTQPTVSTSCSSDLGTARAYGINFFDASPGVDFDDDGDLDRSMIVAGGGFPPSPVPFTVEIDGQIITGVQVGPLSLPAPGASIGVREKVFWYQEIDD